MLRLAEEMGKESRVSPLSELDGAERRGGDGHGGWLTHACGWHGAREPDEIPEPFSEAAGQGKAGAAVVPRTNPATKLGAHSELKHELEC